MVLMPGFQSTRLVTEGALEPFFFLYTDDSIQGNPETCKQSSVMLNYEVKNKYDYQKRNFSTSHVHAMLSTAIIKVMDQSEIVIFLNTDNSIPKVDSTILESYTQSPWIYEEIIFASLLRKRHWSTHRSIPMYEFAERKLQIEYRVPLSGMKEISIETIVDWKKKYDTWLNIEKHYGDLFSSGVTHPLNCLYKIVFGEKE